MQSRTKTSISQTESAFHVEQSIGRSWVFVGISREIWDLRDGTPPNKEKPFQTRKTPPNKEKPFQTRKTPTNKGNTFRARGIFQSNVKVCKW